MADTSVNVFNPQGELKSIPGEQLEDAKAQGYKEASPEDFHNWQNEQEYGGPGGAIKAFAQEAGSAATFGLLPAIQTGLGYTNPYELEGLKEAHPIATGLGGVAGLVGPSLIPGVGEYTAGSLLTKAGEAAESAVGLGKVSEAAQAAAKFRKAGMSAADATKAADKLYQVSMGAKIGSAAVKGAVETALYSSGDEVGKLLTDPEASVDSTMINVGLSGVLGGAFGAGIGSVSPLWSATLGPKATKMIEGIMSKDGSSSIVDEPIQKALQMLGIEAKPEIKSLLGNSELVTNAARNLAEKSTIGGSKMREALAEFKNTLGDTLLDIIQKSPEDLKGLEGVSMEQVGSAMGDTLKDKLKAIAKPIDEAYAGTQSEFAGYEIPKEIFDDAKNKLFQFIVDNKLTQTAFSKKELKTVNTVIKELPNLTNVADIKSYITKMMEANAWDAANQAPYKNAAGIRSILENMQEASIEKGMAEKEGVFRTAANETISPEALQKIGAERAVSRVEQYKNLKSQYRELKDFMQELNDRLHVGKYRGVGTFTQGIDELTGETLARRLGTTKDAGLLDLIKTKIPEVEPMLKDYHVTRMLQHAVERVDGVPTLNTGKFVDLYFNPKATSPELRNFMFNEEVQNKLSSLRDLAENKKLQRKRPDTAGIMDSVLQSLPSAGLGILGFLMGGSPIAVAGLSTLGNAIFREGGDALKYAMLKFLGSGTHVSADGMKAAVDYVGNVIKGRDAFMKGVQNVFKAGAVVVPERLAPKEKDREKLKDYVSQASSDPSRLVGQGDHVGIYMDDHNSALAQTRAKAVQYLNTQLQPPIQKAMFDKTPPKSKSELAQENRMLNIAQQPLMILQHIKDGTLTAQDMVTAYNINPTFVRQAQSQIGQKLFEMSHKGEVLPYAQMLSLSVFMGEPLDSTMSPQSIMSFQTTFAPPAPPPGMRAKHSFKDLGKIPFGAANLEQSKEMKRGKL